MTFYSIFISFIFLLVTPYSMFAENLEWRQGQIRDFSQAPSIIKLKVVYESQASYELSYIVEFQKESLENFSVTLSLLGKDGFEIFHKALASCQGDNALDQGGKKYNLKGTFWIPKSTLAEIDGAELVFFTERKKQFD